MPKHPSVSRQGTPSPEEWVRIAIESSAKDNNLNQLRYHSATVCALCVVVGLSLGTTELTANPFAAKRAPVHINIPGGDDDGTIVFKRKITRQIFMDYEVKVFDQKNKVPDILEALALNDSILRQCYMNSLDYDPGAKGDAIFTFVINSETQKLANVTFRRGTLGVSRVAIRCLNERLAALSIPIQKSLIGVVKFKFDVKVH